MEEGKKRKDSETISEGEMDLNDLVDVPERVQFFKPTEPNAMVD